MQDDAVFFDRSRALRDAVFEDIALLERLAAYWILDVLDDSGNNHTIYRFGSVPVGDEVFHVAVRSSKKGQFTADMRDVYLGDLEFCAREYERICDNPASSVRAPRFAVGALYAEVAGLWEIPLLLTEDLTQGGRVRSRDRPMFGTTQFGDTEYRVDFDLLENPEEARERAKDLRFFSDDMRIDMTMQYRIN